MSLVGTRSKSTSLFFGIAELFLGDSLTNEASITPVLSETYYFGCTTNVSINIDKKFLQKFGSDNGTSVLVENLLISSELQIDLDFIEITTNSLSMSLGGTGVDTNILDNLISQPSDLRAELIFTYPNKINTMSLILPKVNVISKSINLGFQGENPMQVPLSLSALK